MLFALLPNPRLQTIVNSMLACCLRPSFASQADRTWIDQDTKTRHQEEMRQPVRSPQRRGCLAARLSVEHLDPSGTASWAPMIASHAKMCGHTTCDARRRAPCDTRLIRVMGVHTKHGVCPAVEVCEAGVSTDGVGEPASSLIRLINKWWHPSGLRRGRRRRPRRQPNRNSSMGSRRQRFFVCSRLRIPVGAPWTTLGNGRSR